MNSVPTRARTGRPGRVLRSFALLILAGVFFLQPVFSGVPGKRLRVLILSGKNNHNWQETTPALKKIYESSGRFVVDVLDDPSKCNRRLLQNYDVIASNWTNFPSRDRDWGEEAENAILDFVRSGKGFVLFHAAGATFPSWREYLTLIGANWGKSTGHGSYHAFNVSVKDEKHPITKVVGDFVITDELWHRMETRPTAHVLCTAFSDKTRGGTGEWEPVVFISNFGRGRSFYLVL
ncbi:MAG: ThuA domain-containing protein, partial [Acidobacteriota bacterium]